MNRSDCECMMNIQRHKWWPLFLSVQLLATVVALSTLVVAQSSSDGAAVCPLSESQTQKSMDAFAKIVPTLTKEPRCVNCHGGVNPFMEGFGEEPNPDLSDGAAEAPGSAPVPSLRAHGGGKMDRRVQPSLGKPGSPPTDCSSCHDTLARKIPSGAESEWALAPTFLQFLGKDAKTLCKQIKDFARGCEKGICGPWPDAKMVLDHFIRDEGRDNFTGTAFMGNRGLNLKDYPELHAEPPKIKREELLKLVKEWIATTGGEFKGDKSCGCEPAHYAVRYSTSTEVNIESIHHNSAMEPADIPITFKDDGTYTGEGKGTYKAAGTAAGCTEQSGLDVAFTISGQATETSQKQSMHVDLEYPSPMAYTMTAECDGESGGAAASIPSMSVKSPFDFKGDVGEEINKEESAMEGIVSKLQVKIVKLPEPEP